MNSEFDLVVFAYDEPRNWQIVIWSFIENLPFKGGGSGVLIQTIDRSDSWVFKDMGAAYKFCFDTGKVPVDENGCWDDNGDLNAGLTEAEPVPLIAWRRYWKKDSPPESPEFQSPDWK